MPAFLPLPPPLPFAPPALRGRRQHLLSRPLFPPTLHARPPACCASQQQQQQQQQQQSEHSDEQPRPLPPPKPRRHSLPTRRERLFLEHHQITRSRGRALHHARSTAFSLMVWPLRNAYDQVQVHHPPAPSPSSPSASLSPDAAESAGPSTVDDSGAVDPAGHPVSPSLAPYPTLPAHEDANIGSSESYRFETTDDTTTTTFSSSSYSSTMNDNDDSDVDDASEDTDEDEDAEDIDDSTDDDPSHADTTQRSGVAAQHVMQSQAPSPSPSPSPHQPTDRAHAAGAGATGRCATAAKPPARHNLLPEIPPWAYVVRVRASKAALGKRAVQRNRAKRRLRAAAAQVLPAHARRHMEYVFSATPECLVIPFDELVGDMHTALRSTRCWEQHLTLPMLTRTQYSRRYG